MPATVKLLSIRENARALHHLEDILSVKDETVAVSHAKSWAWTADMRRAEVWNEMGEMVFYTSQTYGTVRVYAGTIG